MNNELLSSIVLIIMMVAVLAMSGYVIPVLKERIGEERLATLKSYISMAVKYAEQIYTPEQWAEKKNYVSSYILRKANDAGLDEKEIDMLIEAIVYELKHEG